MKPQKPKPTKAQLEAERMRELGRWAQEQRIAYHAGILSQHRIDKLNAIGFDWNEDPMILGDN
jgi:hypothetical protein